MKIFNENIKTYRVDATRTFNFARFNNQAGDFWLIEGFLDFRGLEKIKNEKIVHMEFEEPNRFLSSDPLFRHEQYEDYLYKIFSICPYTVKWLNKKLNNSKRTVAFIPFNEEKIPKNFEKKYDIIYAGHIFQKYTDELDNSMKVLKKFNYRLVAPKNYALSTNPGIGYDEKIKLISESKITLVHNLLFLRGQEIRNVQNTDGYKENEAYSLIPEKNFFSRFTKQRTIVPQVKSRLFDAAFCKSLILCRKDPWNVIERFFEPEKEFIYYEPGKLEEKIREVLSNYEAYKPIIENAYKRAVREYTTEAYFNKFLKNIK